MFGKALSGNLVRYSPIGASMFAIGLAAGCASIDNKTLEQTDMQIKQTNTAIKNYKPVGVDNKQLLNKPQQIRLNKKTQTARPRYPVSIPDKIEFDSSIIKGYVKQIDESVLSYASRFSNSHMPKGRNPLSKAEKKELRKSIIKFNWFCEKYYNMKGMVLTAEALDDNPRYYGWSGNPNTVGDNGNPVLTAVLKNNKWNFF